MGSSKELAFLMSHMEYARAVLVLCVDVKG